MAVALPSSPPPAFARPSPLPITAEHVHRVRSKTKRATRKRSRELIASAMRAERATPLDFADALEVNERRVRHALEISEDAACIDVGEVLAMAATGAGGARLARRVLSELLREIDSIELASGHR
jgi:hypothetical protein